MHTHSGLSGLNLLLSLGAPAQGGNVSDSQHGEGGGANNALFAQLLGDLGAQTNGQGGQQLPSGKLLPLQAGGVLAAQGLKIHTPEPTLPLDQPITVADASAMLQQLAALMQQHGDHSEKNPHERALAKVKDQLQQIVSTDTPKSLGQILEAVPEVKEPKLAGLLGGLLQAVKKLAAKEQNSKEEEAPDALLSSMQQLPAMMFSADGRAATATKAGTSKPEEKTQTLEADDIVANIPLAQAATAQAAAPVQTGITQAALPSQPTIDDLVPALTPVASKQPERTELPEVNLPSMRAAEKDGKTAYADHDDSANTASLVADNLAAHSALHTPVPHAAKTIDLMPTPGFVNHAAPKEQVHVAITQAAHDGLDKITIQLEPEALGRVEVKLHTTSDGQTQITFLVDKPDTFDSLSRDARFLERSLQEAGIKADTGSMQFNLRQQPQPQLQSNLGGQGQRSQQQATEEESAAANDNNSIAAVSSLVVPARHYTINVRDGVDISA